MFVKDIKEPVVSVFGNSYASHIRVPIKPEYQMKLDGMDWCNEMMPGCKIDALWK